MRIVAIADFDGLMGSSINVQLKDGINFGASLGRFWSLVRRGVICIGAYILHIYYVL